MAALTHVHTRLILMTAAALAAATTGCTSAAPSSATESSLLNASAATSVTEATDATSGTDGTDATDAGTGDATHGATAPATAAPAADTSAIVPASSAGPARWRPVPGLRFQVQYEGTPNLTVPADVYFLDGEETSAATVTAIHKRGQRAVCYVSAGSWEEWRADRAAFPSSVLGRAMDGWAGERWVDIRRTSVLMPIMTKRMQGCKAKGFDAVDPDNVMLHQESGTGFTITAAQQLAYNQQLAAAAHRLGLAYGLKNDIGQVKALLPLVDFAINEECIEQGECAGYAPLVAARKPVYNIEYAGAIVSVCAQSRVGFSTIKKRLSLDYWRQACTPR